MQYAPIYGRGSDVTITSGGTFDAVIYTGGALRISGWDLPVVVDLVGLRPGKLLVANLDHNKLQRVGIIDELDNNGRRLRAKGRLNAATKFRDEVVASHREGYRWQASIEVNPDTVEEIKTRVAVNGQSFDGPLYVTRTGTLKGFGFVSHGADDDTIVNIAASRVPQEYSPPYRYYPAPSREYNANGYIDYAGANVTTIYRSR